jgi:putative ABC transport system permease protein
MSEWSLAIRNLLRNRRRSLSTLLALAVGLTAILLFSGFKANLGYTMLTAFVRSGGHLQIQHRDYFLYGSGNPTAYAIADYADLLEEIRSDVVLEPMLSMATPMLRFGGLAGNFDAGISRTVIGTGYVAQDMGRMRQWNQFRIPNARPQFMLEGTPSDAAVVGMGLARVLQLCAALHLEGCPAPAPLDSTPTPKAAAGLPSDIALLAQEEHRATTSKQAPRTSGARIELLSSSVRGAPNVATLDVVAAEDQGFKELDEISVILNLGYAQSLVFGRGPPKITAILVQLENSADQGVAARRLREILDRRSATKDLVVRTFSELNPFYVQSEQLFSVIFDFISILIGGIVLFTVVNTMNAAVVERTVEIGTLRAIGLRRQGIRRLFVIEGLVLGCAGAIAGIIAALVLAALINHSGLTWLPPGSSEQLPLQLRVLGERTTVAVSTLGLIFIASASAWWPAWHAAKMKVVDALRHA